MNSYHKLQNIAQALGEKLKNRPEVSEYLIAVDNVQNNAEIRAKEELLLNLFQSLSALEQAGKPLDKDVLANFYQLRDEVNSDPLIIEREKKLHSLKNLYQDVNGCISAELGLDFTLFAL